MRLDEGVLMYLYSKESWSKGLNNICNNRIFTFQIATNGSQDKETGEVRRWPAFLYSIFYDQEANFCLESQTGISNLMSRNLSLGL